MKYKKYADDIAALISSGQLKPGEKLPSVRVVGSQRGLSPITVLKAYHQLESRGLIVARERSGFFVAEKSVVQLASPSRSEPSRQAMPVSKSDFIFEILQSSKSLEVIPLGSAFPSPLLFPHAKLNRAMSRAVKRMDPWRSVTDLTPGSEGLREQIALRYQISGIAIDRDELIITDGAMEGLNLCLQAVTQPGDTVIVESPTFCAALQAIERLGLQAIEVATDPKTGMDIDALERVLVDNSPSACWVMSSFQNPTGARMTDENKSRMVKLLADHGVPIIEDDTYGELYFQASRPLPLKAFDQDGGVLHCGSFSKCLAPGYRVGWTTAGRYTDRVQRLKLGLTLSASLPSQLALEEYLAEADFERHLKSFRRDLMQGRDAFLQAVQSYFPDETSITQPDGGYFLWLELPRGVSALELHRRALAQNISIAPGDVFGVQDDFSNCVRLNFGHPEDRRINRALKTLGELVSRLMDGADRIH